MIHIKRLMILLVICISALVAWQVIAAPALMSSLVYPGESVRYTWAFAGQTYFSKLSVDYCGSSGCSVRIKHDLGSDPIIIWVYDEYPEELDIPQLTFISQLGAVYASSQVKNDVEELYLPRMEKP